MIAGLVPNPHLAAVVLPHRLYPPLKCKIGVAFPRFAPDCGIRWIYPFTFSPRYNRRLTSTNRDGDSALYCTVSVTVTMVTGFGCAGVVP
jgi:hypothetical protein